MQYTETGILKLRYVENRKRKANGCCQFCWKSSEDDFATVQEANGEIHFKYNDVNG